MTSTVVSSPEEALSIWLDGSFTVISKYIIYVVGQFINNNNLDSILQIIYAFVSGSLLISIPYGKWNLVENLGVT